MFRAVHIVNAVLAGGVFAFLPPPLEPLWPQVRFPSTVSVDSPPGLGASVEVERRVILEGGSSPWISLRRDRVLSTGGVERGWWAAHAWAGASDGHAEASAGEWGLRWIPDGESVLGARIRFGRELRATVSFHQEDGMQRGCIEGRIPIGMLGLEGEASRSTGRGVFELLQGDSASVPLGWTGIGWRAAGGTTMDVPSWGRAFVRLLREEGRPGPVEGRYRLELRSTSSGWEMGWIPFTTGPWVSFANRDVDVRSSGWSDTLGSDRRFHDLRVRGRWRAVSGGWRSSRWSVGARGEDRDLDVPRASYFTPLLAWNVLDPSEWSPVDQILSDQREHLSGKAELRSLGVSSSWNRPGRRVDVGLGADLSWNALDIHLLHRSTRLVFLGMGNSIQTDSVGAPRLRVALLSLDGAGAIHLGRFGDLRASGGAAIPLWLKRLRRDGAAPASPASGGGDGGGGSGSDMQGLWTIGAGWRGVW